MRSFAIVACSLVLAVTATAEANAKPKREAHHAAKEKSKRSARARFHEPAKSGPRIRAAYVIRGSVEGQSLGQPWQGKLHDPTQLEQGEGYVIRRPYRAFGTKTTVEFIHHAITDLREQFPEAHVFAVGDISQESGRWWPR